MSNSNLPAQAGILGGVIWCTGQSFSLIASGKSGAAIPYGLDQGQGQGTTLISAIWGIFIWKEFKGTPELSRQLNIAMFILFLTGLDFLVYAGS